MLHWVHPLFPIHVYNPSYKINAQLKKYLRKTVYSLIWPTLLVSHTSFTSIIFHQITILIPFIIIFSNYPLIIIIIISIIIIPIIIISIIIIIPIIIIIIIIIIYVILLIISLIVFIFSFIVLITCNTKYFPKTYCFSNGH